MVDRRAACACCSTPGRASRSCASGVGARPPAIDAVAFQGKPGRFAIRAEVVIDATGDGDLFAAAGCALRAREGAAVAVVPHGRRRATSTRALARPAAGTSAPSATARCCCRWGATERIGRKIDATDPDDLTFAELECRRLVMREIDRLRAEVPQFRDAHVCEIATRARHHREPAPARRVRAAPRRHGPRLRRRDRVTGHWTKYGVALRDPVPLAPHVGGSTTSWSPGAASPSIIASITRPRRSRPAWRPARRPAPPRRWRSAAGVGSDASRRRRSCATALRAAGAIVDRPRTSSDRMSTPRIESRIRTDDPEFQENAAAHEGAASTSCARGSPRPAPAAATERARRHTERGKLLPRASASTACSIPARPSSSSRRSRPTACTTATRRRREHRHRHRHHPRAGQAVIVANDATVKGGTYFPMTVKKHLRAQEIALENRLPCVYLVDSGGAFLPLQAEVFPDREHFGRIFYNQARMSALGIPQIAVVMGSCTAGGAYVPAMSDEIVIVRGTGHDLPRRPAAGEGGDRRGGDRRGARRRRRPHPHLRRLRSPGARRPPRARASRATSSRTLRRAAAARARAARRPRSRPTIPAEIYGIVPRDPRKPYDVREVIARLVDGSRFHEFKARYGTDAGHRLRAPPRLPGRHRRQQRRALLRVGAQGARTSSSSAASAACRCSSCRTSPASWSARSTSTAASPRTAPRWCTRSPTPRVPKLTVRRRRLVRRRQLRHVRPRLLAALPLHVAEQPHLGDGRRAGGAARC